MSDDNNSPLNDILPVMSEGEAKNKTCFLTRDTCMGSECMAWKTLVEHDYTTDPKKEEPLYFGTTETIYGDLYNDPSVPYQIRARDYEIKYSKIEIEWEKVDIDGKTIYRRRRLDNDRLGYCMKLVT